MRLAVVLRMMCVTAPAFAQGPGKPPVGAATSRPLGWEATKARVMALGLDGKHQETVALLEPIVHWHFEQLLIKEGRTAELPAGFKVARAALPASPPDARLEFASLLTGLAERTASIPVKTAMAAEALAYANETLKSHPTGFYSRRAQALKDDVARLRQTKGGD